MNMFQNAVIVDVEATCCNQGTIARRAMEIIEVGAVAVQNSNGAIVAEFQTFVRPKRNPTLTPFCKSLTSISQADVDLAELYPAAILRFRQWLAEIGSYEFCSWGDYDRKQFEQDSRYHGVAYPFAGPHRNLKVEFSAALGITKKHGVSSALEKLGLDFEGTAHRGIDDARNIARIYRQAILA